MGLLAMPQFSSGRAALTPLRDLFGRTWVRNLLGVGVLALIVVTLLAIDTLLGDDGLGPLDSRRPNVGEPAPVFALEDGDGNDRRLDDFLGKAVWLNFWATTCGPCREELPSIEKVEQEFSPDELQVLAINQQESPGRAEDYLQDIGVELTVLFDRDGDVSQQYRLQGLPYNFLVDRDGVLRSFKPGFLTEEEMRSRLLDLGLRPD